MEGNGTTILQADRQAGNSFHVIRNFCFFVVILIVLLLSVSSAFAVDINSEYYTSWNPFHTSGYGLPNCTCFAWGRAYEVTGVRPNLSTGNANTFWNYNINHGYYPYGTEPMPGAIACWNGGDGGHVAYVEAVSGDTVYISQSGWGWRYSRPGVLWENTSVNKYNMESVQTGFQGYIYIGGTPEFGPPDINADVVGTSAQLSWNDTFANSYYVYAVNLDTNTTITGENIGRQLYYHYNLSPGHYRVFVTAVYSADNMKSGWTDIYCAIPQTPVVTATVNGTVANVSWNDVAASSYYIYAYDTDTNTVADAGENIGKQLSYQYQLPEGHYKIFVTAVYSADNMKSSGVEVEIALDAPALTATVTQLTANITWNDVGASSYYTYAYNIDTNTVADAGENIGKQLSYQYHLPKGHYRIIVTAVYSADNMKSGWAVISLGMNPDFTIPADTRMIEDEAFRGCAFTYAQLSEKTISVGNNAFADCPNLTDIYLGEGIVEIGMNAIPDGVFIHGKPGSFAETYAALSGFVFIPET